MIIMIIQSRPFVCDSMGKNSILFLQSCRSKATKTGYFMHILEKGTKVWFLTCSADETFLTGFKRSIHVCLSVDPHMICVFYVIFLHIKPIQIKYDAIFYVFSSKWILETIIDTIARAFHSPYWFTLPIKTSQKIENMKKRTRIKYISYFML